MFFIDALIILSAILSSLWVLLQAFYFTRKEITCKHHEKGNSSVSIIVAIKDEEPSVIKELIENLSSLNYENYEVIIISDDKEERFRELSTLSRPPNFKLVRRDLPRGRKAGALNYGVSLAKGDILVFLDAEARVDPDFLVGVSHHLARSPALSLRLRVRDPKNKLQRLYSGITEFSMNSLFRGRYLKGLPVFPNGSAFAIRSKVLRDVGGWKEGIVAEDLEIGIRLYMEGVDVEYVDDVIVETLAPYSWKDLFIQLKRWAYGSGQLLPYSLQMAKKGLRGIEGAIYANQWGVYPVFLVVLLIAGLLSPLFFSSVYTWIGSLSLFLISTLVFSVRSNTKEYDIRIPTLMISAFIIGYISGLMKTGFNWKVTPKKEVSEDETWIPLEVNLVSFIFLGSGLIAMQYEFLQGCILLIISLILLVIP
ncbi:glycosyltransferase [Metallosphaera hakonensis]|uniref:Glycosyl transferase n=1 Tax=Metallosphaera hakonensis JCM 8857 = DSM 7519 TaxID=1293036 RepID=A0A2U9IS35_9CREN|nr:glycosyltransferase family 2 protein [Metallosphaera hakonensis]AWR98826.1 glycosyltransferase [Metallosphaera hakonensis JCM 8857 = DSM 7519]